MDMETHAGNMVLIIKFIWIFYVECQFSFVIINSSFSSVCSNLTLTGRITSVLLLLPTHWLALVPWIYPPIWFLKSTGSPVRWGCPLHLCSGMPTIPAEQRAALSGFAQKRRWKECSLCLPPTVSIFHGDVRSWSTSCLSHLERLHNKNNIPGL